MVVARRNRSGQPLVLKEVPIQDLEAKSLHIYVAQAIHMYKIRQPSTHQSMHSGCNSRCKFTFAEEVQTADTSMQRLQ